MLPFLVGGTGLYLSAVLQKYELTKMEFIETEKFAEYSLEELKIFLKNLSPKLHNTTDLIERERIIKAILVEQSGNENKLKVGQINSFNIGIKLGRKEIKHRITERLKKRLSDGMIEEVENLIKDGISYDRLKLLGLEYKYIAMHINNELNYNDMFQKLNSSIHNFAKRQMTWFRKMEREGVKINWIEGADYEQAKKIIEENYNLK
jgi:tRNA dimethylallyltransferase